MLIRLFIAGVLLSGVLPVKAQKMVPFRKGKLWGFANKSGHIVIPCTYERTTFFETELARVKKANKWGLLDSEGEMFLPCSYDIVYGALKQERIVVCKGGDKDGHHGRWGMVPRYQGHEIPLEYELMRECGIPGLLGVYQDGKWGVLNQFSKITIPIQYEVQDIADHTFQQHMVVAFDQTKVSQLFPMKPKKYLKLRFERGLARVSKQGKWGYINPQGAEVIPLVYDFLGEFSEGLVCAIKKVDNQLKIGFLDRENRIIIPFVYDFVEEAYKYLKAEQGLIPLRKNGKWGYLNISNEVSIPFQYAQASIFKQGMALVSTSLSTLMPSWKCIDDKGNTLFELDQEYQLSEAYFQEGFLKVESQEKEGFVDVEGNLLGRLYDKVLPFQQGLAQVFTQHDNQWKTGFINTQGREIIPLIYDCGEAPQTAQRWGRYFFLKKNGLKGVVDTKNRVVISFTYEDILLPRKNAFNLAKLAVKKEGYWGYINQKEKWVIPARYNKVANFHWKYALVEYQGKPGYIDYKGKEFFEE